MTAVPVLTSCIESDTGAQRQITVSLGGRDGLEQQSANKTGRFHIGAILLLIRILQENRARQ